MANKHINGRIFLVALIFIIQYTIINNQSKAQLVLTTVGSTETIDFTGFTGSGFSPTPAPGQLDSKTWSVTGFSDGDSGFDSTKTTGDFARGASSGGVSQGGIYAFDVGGDTILGVQPIGSDFTPGSFILKIQNNTGSPIMQLDVSYEIWVYNDQNRATSLNFSYSSDNLTYTNAPGLDFTTVEAADSLVGWIMTSRTITITDTTIANNDFFYLKWTGNDVSGAGSRDEYGIDNIQVTAIPSLLADFSFADACFGETVCFTDLSTTTGSTIIQWCWYFGDGFAFCDTVPNPCYFYVSNGTYSVQLIVTDDSSNTDTVTQILNVYPLPMPDFAGTSVCLGDSTQFSDMSAISAGSITSWNWDFGDSVGTSTFQNPTYLYVAPGTYIVTLIVTSDNGCTDTIAQSFDVFSTPIIDITSMVIDSSNCGISDGAIMGITASGGTPPLTYEWVDDSLIIVGGDSANLVNVPSGSYTLTVTNSEGCSAISGPYIIVDLGAPPAPTASSPSPYCEGDAIADLTATGTGGTLIWYTDAALTDSVFSGSPVASGATTDTSFWVAETVAGCEGPATQVDITVNPVPSAGFTTGNVCLNDIAVFTDTSTISSGNIIAWQWNFGDGFSIDTNQNPSHNYLSDSLYFVTLSVMSNNGCTGSALQTIEIYPLPVANFTASPLSGVAPLTVNYADLSTITGGSIVSRNWDFGDGNSDTLPNPTNIYTSLGTYTVCLTVISNQGCSDTICYIDTVNVGSVGIKENTSKSVISIYPNPTNNGMVYVDFGNVIYDDVQLTVYNILGETVQYREMIGQDKQVIDLSGFTKGVYLLYFRSENFSIAKKLQLN